MDIAIKLASICVGGKNYELSKRSILDRNDISANKKLHMLKALTKAHQQKVYRLLIKVCKILKTFYKLTGCVSLFLSMCLFGAESEILGMNILLGLFVLIFTFLSYKFYNFTDEHLFFYRIKLKETRR